MIVLSLDIGGTHLRIGAIDQGGTVLKFEKLPTASVIHSDHVLSDLSDFLRSFAAGLSVDAIAIGFPATLDRSRRVVVQAPNIPFMENLPVCDYLQIVLQAAFWPPDSVSSLELYLSPEPVH